jgi:hypothetical protein
MIINKLPNLFLVLSCILVLFGCTKDLFEEHSHGKPISKDISIEEFKRETGLNQFKPQVTIPPNPGMAAFRTADGGYELSDFDIDISLIKRLVVNEKVTYTFQLIPKEEVNDRIFNIVYYFKEGWQYDIIEIKPNPQNLIQLKEGTTKTIDGTLAKLYSSYPVESINNCTYYTIINYTCQGCQGECDLCNICVDYINFTECEGEPASLYLAQPPGLNNGGGGSSTGHWYPPIQINTTNENQIATTPVINNLQDTDQNPQQKTPCNELKKFTTNNSIQLSLRILKGQSSGVAERGFYIKDTINSVGATYLTYPVIPPNPNNPNELDVAPGLATGRVKAMLHCHTDPATTRMIPMLTAADFGNLYNIASYHNPLNNAQKDYAEYTVMLSVGSGHYALKFKNFDGNYYTLNHNIDDFREKLEDANKLLGSTAPSSDLIKVFLKHMNNYFGNEVGLYKATEGLDSNGQPIVTGWKEQTLNESGNIVEIECP